MYNIVSFFSKQGELVVPHSDSVVFALNTHFFHYLMDSSWPPLLCVLACV